MTISPTERQIAARPHIKLWLYGVATLLIAMVLVGGATRLTDSGLSITEWQPLLGVIPPLGADAWQEAFAKYREIPEYQHRQCRHDPREFKFIYWWEWVHRFLGRFIGVAFLLPFLFFCLSRSIERGLWWRLLALFLLGGAQGALGWYMVKSGLVDRVDVSQYRLAAHLSLAVAIFAAALWIAWGIGGDAGARCHGSGRRALAAVVAGGTGVPPDRRRRLRCRARCRAGLQHLAADGRRRHSRRPRCHVARVAQSVRECAHGAVRPPQHRLSADRRSGAELRCSVRARNRSAGRPRRSCCWRCSGRSALGIWTLLEQVPLPLGLAHQAGALIVLIAALWNLDRAVGCASGPSPDRDRR